MIIALVGNPNVGKSVIFNALTGKYVTVSNYPGTTVEVAKGEGRLSLQKFSVIDTPGINSLTPHSEDEKVTKDILSKSGISVIVQVADSKNLRRSLPLTLELLELGIPLILDLNMKDEASERGIKIDIEKLSARLGIEIVETTAITGDGIAKLKKTILKTKAPMSGLSAKVPKTSNAGATDITLLRGRTKIAEELTKETSAISGGSKRKLPEAISRATMRPLTGIPILILIMIFMYLFVGKFAAGKVVDFLEKTVFEGIVNPFFITVVNKYMPITFIKEFLVGNYGVITMALTYAFAIIFPIVTAFFLFFGILEDSGYLPRLSILSDRAFKTIGLNGRAILPIVLGLGCGTMATLTTRILDTKKERILVTLLLALAVPCSAQLGVIMGMLGSLSGKAVILWFSALLFVMALVGFAASRVVPGQRSTFIQEIPPIRMPQAKNIAVKTFARLKWYLKEAVPLFMLGTALLFILDKLSLLKEVEHILSPLVVHLLSLPEKATEAFIVGFLRRDYGAAGLYALSRAGMLDHIQIFTSLIVITLFVPCVAQFFVTVKERGIKAACVIGTFVFIFAFLFGGAVNFVLRYLLNRGIEVI